MFDGELKQEVAADLREEPAKRWRNKWRFFVLDVRVGYRDGFIEIVGPGVYWDKEIYPSKDVAETRAAALKRKDGWLSLLLHRYDGAFPLDETP